MATPVTKRSRSAGPSASTDSASAALATAPTSALPAMRWRADQMSGRLVRALASVPAMKPSCTAMVRPALPPGPSAHSRWSAGRTAEALNQRLSASSSASARALVLLDDLLFAEGDDLRCRQAEILEDEVGMLAGEGRGRAHAARRLGELDGHADLAHAPVRRMLGVDDHLPVVDLRVAHHLLDVVDLAHADVGLHEQVVPLVAVA